MAPSALSGEVGHKQLHPYLAGCLRSTVRALLERTGEAFAGLTRPQPQAWVAKGPRSKTFALHPKRQWHGGCSHTLDCAPVPFSWLELALQSQFLFPSIIKVHYPLCFSTNSFRTEEPGSHLGSSTPNLVT